MPGLSVSDVVSATINLQPLAVPARNFGALLVLGPSDVIDITERTREYATLDEVVADYSLTDPEYLAADLFFSQSPQPSILYIGRWAQSGTAGIMHGAVFGALNQAALLTSLQAISTGSMQLMVDGTNKVLSAVDLTGAVNLNGVASILTTAMGNATVTWNQSYGRFDIESHTNGSSSTIGYASATGTGTDLSALLGLTLAAGASPPIAGVAAETPLAAVQASIGQTADIYGVTFAPTLVGDITDTEYEAVAAYIEGVSPSRIFGITTQESGALDPTVTNDLASVLKAANYSRTFIQYSSSSPYAVASMYGRAFTVDFNANNSTITLKFKSEPGVTAETLNETQAATLKAKSCNQFVNYNNGAAIIQEGVMSSGIFFDERHGTDWLANNVQTRVWNLFVTSPTKIPQTDPGTHKVATTVEAAFEDGVNNGLIAPGIWTSSLEFGQLSTGQTLSKGYYVFAPAVASQSQADREARKLVTLQCAVKLAGAVHSANVTINVNR